MRLVTQSSQYQVQHAGALSRSDSRTVPNTSSNAFRHLGKMPHLSVSVDTVPQQVIPGPRHAVRLIAARRRADIARCRRSPYGNAEGTVPVGRNGRAARLWRVPPQPYTQRRSPDVPPQSPVQGLCARGRNTAPRPALPRRRAAIARTAPAGQEPNSGNGTPAPGSPSPVRHLGGLCDLW